MEYAKILQQSVGKSDYRESPLKTLMKVNELRKTINKDGRANIIKQEPYANKISTYLSNEELKRKMNDGATSYKMGVQSAYDDYQLEKLKNDPLKYIEKARKQAELMKLFNNPSQIEYLRKTDPIGLFYLEQAQDEEKQKDLLEQQQKQQQQEQEARENAIATEAQRVQVAREQEEARQEGIRQAVVGPPIGELEQYFKGPRDVKVNSQGNLTINGNNVSIPVAVARLQKFAPELLDTMSAREIASRYRDSQIRQASERSGISLPQFKAELNRRKDAERMQRFLVTKEKKEPIDIGTLFDDGETMDIKPLFDEEEPIVQQHAQELMDENPDLDDIEADRQARENVVEARQIAPELLPPPPPEFLREPILPMKPNYAPPPPPAPSTWEEEAMGEEVPTIELGKIEMVPSTKILNNIRTKETLVKLAEKYKVPYNDSDSVDVVRQKLKNFRKLQKRMETYGVERIEAPAPEPEPSPAETYKAEPIESYGMTSTQLKSEAQKRGITVDQLMSQLFDEQEERLQQSARENITPEDIRQLEKLKEMGYDSEDITDNPDKDVFAKTTRNSSRRTLKRVLKGQFGTEFVENYVKSKAEKRDATPAPAQKIMSVKELKELAKSKGVTGIKSRDTRITIEKKARDQGKDLEGKGFEPTGSGFRPLSSYPPHIIAGALHIVKQRKKLRTNPNEYNREQAHHLTQKAIHGEGFFGDLKDKLMNWAFYNIHPLGRMTKFVQEQKK